MMQTGLEKQAKTKGVVAVRLEQGAGRRKVWNVHLGRCARRAETKVEACLEWMKMVMLKRKA